MQSPVDWSVYVITDRRIAAGHSMVELVQAALAGGATVIQLRDKDASTRELLALGRALHAVTSAHAVPLIINDRVDIAHALGAEGVHLGIDDLPVAQARAILGPDSLIGMSPETLAQARAAEQDGASYLGVGDVYGTRTKSDAGPPIGLEGLSAMVQAVRIPVVAVGGITAANAARAIACGAAGVVVISAVIGAPDPAGAARQLRQVVQAARTWAAQTDDQI